MQTYSVTLEHPGLYGDSHMYSTATVRAGSPERASRIAERRNGGRAVAVSPARR